METHIPLIERAEEILGISITPVADAVYVAAHYANEVHTGYWLTATDLQYAEECAQYGNDAYSHWCAGTGTPMTPSECRRELGSVRRVD